MSRGIEFTCQSPTALADIPVVDVERLTESLSLAMENPTCGLSALFAVPAGPQTLRLYAITSDAADGKLQAIAGDVGDQYPSVTQHVSQAHWFEREIAEQWGVKPLGHPWLKPIRFHRSYRQDHDAWGRTGDQPIVPGILPAENDYFRVEGDEIHEVAVGPVHAGVIEPGHFRFQCHGEHVFTLEIELGYQHRGVARRLVGGPDKRTLHYMETLAGDTSVGHASAYCQLVEGLAGIHVPVRYQALRAIGLELERLANHTGDLGALAGDVGYLPTLSFCGRIRGDFLNCTMLICGSRFGRDLVRPGGVRYDVDAAMVEELLKRVRTAQRDVIGAADLLWKSASVMARFENTGIVSQDTAEALGVIGMAGRASGVDRDARRDFPSGYFRYRQIPVATWHTGDAFARAYVRYLEIKRSCEFVGEVLRELPSTRQAAPQSESWHELKLKPEAMHVAIVEGWRGEICHVALTDQLGRFAHYQVVDPSFHNWIGLSMALRDQQISDFPLCNKSFNLSYCGHDL
ncbi:MAG: hydrogenase [Planctomycetota bacterium]|nr:MAG: hydrogenase [Planctomycetota bacterium]